jgi:hypothetical protein
MTEKIVVSTESLTREKVEEWHAKACIRKLNVFDDRNLIIATLSKALLEAWDKNENQSN